MNIVYTTTTKWSNECEYSPLLFSEAWVTLATNDSYALGAMVLATSLRRVATTRQLAVLVTPGVSASMRSALVQNILQFTE
jgi:hypothetical protein